MKITILLLGMLLSWSTIFAQGSYLPVEREDYHHLDRFDIIYGRVLPNLHTNLKPISRKTIAEFADSLAHSGIVESRQDEYLLQRLRMDNAEWSDSLYRSKMPVLRYFYRDPANLLHIKSEDFVLILNPLIEYRLGKENDNKETMFVNTRGIEMRSYIKKKLGLYAWITENQLRGPVYHRQLIKDEQAVPGEGFFKEFKTSAVDFFNARGYITFNVLKYIDVQFGHDKHFLGNGFRSLLLSDYGNNYLFLKLNTQIWRIRYTNLFTEFTHQYNRGGDQLLDKKFGAFHHLNINFASWLDVGIFEGIVLTRSKQYELQYLNPIIFYRSIEQDLGSPDNAMVGADWKVNFLDRFSFYGQFVLDEFNLTEIRAKTGWWANKYGYQAGLKYVNVGGLDNLDAQVEYNMVMPYTFTHNNSRANYTHYNQPLAHPYGANFKEFVAMLRYRPLPRLNLIAKFINIEHGADSSGTNWGGDIFRSYTNAKGQLNVERAYDNEILQGVKQKTVFFDFLASYEIRHNLFVDLHYINRNFTSDIETRNSNTNYFTLGARWNLPFRGYNY